MQTPQSPITASPPPPAGYAGNDRPIPTPPVVANVRDFGAKGDGVSDDSAAFLEAIEATNNGALYVPPGRYNISRVLWISKSNFVLRGAGQVGAAWGLRGAR